MTERITKMGKHLTRKQLFEIIKEGKEFPHLKDCPECREALSLLKVFYMVDMPRLAEPPRGWVDKAVAIFPSESKAKSWRELVEMVFDSWSIPHPVGVRGSGGLSERRIQFRAGEYIFDMRAEHRRQDWLFVAQINRPENLPAASVVKVGKKEIMADAAGLFIWSSKRPPARLGFVTGDKIVDLPELAWKKPLPPRR